MWRSGMACAAVAVLVGCASVETERGGQTESDPLAGLSESHERDLQVRAELLGIADPPVVAPVRVVSPEEHYVLKYECLRAQGFDVELVEDGLNVTFAGAEGDSYFLADYVCFARYPVHRMYREQLTEAQVRAQFDYLTGPLSTCLRDAGFSPADPPTWESFLASQRGGQDVWAPIGPQHGDLAEVLLGATQACDFNTPMDLLYPESD